ncbi:MAG TPA: hypothetical protein DCZ38_00975 [Coxiellaceae bacterium]|nr:MAG: hypothetical protein A2V89_02505 [Gammaproteobacteria bacterium RBG_16_37_9]HBC71342.1 hypothetical protein [Coxiellaceae bacterium]
MRAVGANELINITVLSRQQRGNPETILDNSKFKKISKAQNTIIQNRSWFASPSARYCLPYIRSLAPAVRDDDTFFIRAPTARKDKPGLLPYNSI